MVPYLEAKREVDGQLPPPQEGVVRGSCPEGCHVTRQLAVGFQLLQERHSGLVVG